MKTVSGRRMCKVLRAKGWIPARTQGSHHVYLDPVSRRVLPVPVHGNRDLPTGTQKEIMRKAGLTDADL